MQNLPVIRKKSFLTEMNRLSVTGKYYKETERINEGLESYFALVKL